MSLLILLLLLLLLFLLRPPLQNSLKHRRFKPNLDKIWLGCSPRKLKYD